ncbi:MAG TPA: response regulator [Chloroflexi bacterium]|jgi:DNA-binding response OmpR family regulator|nr:response regulator [Chloroflexota bacterium]
MAQYAPPRRRALIVEDEIVIALDLQDAMSNLGFDVSDLAPSPNRAFSLAMSHKPDIVLMDVCLDGGREGIEAARWLREVCEVPVVFVTGYKTQTLSSVSTSECPVLQCYQSRFIVRALPTR